MPLIHDSEVDAKQDHNEASERKNKIRVKNRRKTYLDKHPEYLISSDRELSGASNFTQLTKAKLT